MAVLRDDLDELQLLLLENGYQVEIHDDEYTYDSLDEAAKRLAPSAKSLDIVATGVDSSGRIAIHFNGRLTLLSHGPSDRERNVGTQALSLLTSRRSRSYRLLAPTAWLYVATGPLLVASLALRWLNYAFAVLLLSTFLVGLVGVAASLVVHGRFRPVRFRARQDGFWRRNGDRVLVAVVTAIITVLVTRVVPYILSRVWP